MVGRNETKLNNVAQQYAADGLAPLIIRADLANEEEAKTIIKKTIDHFGQLNVLVNYAGIVKCAPVTDPNILQTYDSVMNTNLRSVVQLTSLAAHHLIETKGNIVNISSITAQRAFAPAFVSYCVSKIGLDHFTRCAALELAASGVRVNSVNPGPVRTDIVENSGVAASGNADEFWNQSKALTALGRVGKSEEIADLIAFLASDRARSITGSNFVSDNGTLLKHK